MNDTITVRALSVGVTEDAAMLRAFLARHALGFEADIDAAFGVFDEDEVLRGCGCAAQSLLKCFAVDEALRGQNALGALVSRLVQDRFAKGYYDLRVITRAHNEPLFAACGFYPVVRTDALVLLENLLDGPRRFAQPFFARGDEDKTVGAIVMNANPFTLGHRALVEYAAALQSELDVTLFASAIAPVLHITRRFAGEEPLDPVTSIYNSVMARILPRCGIEFVTIPRLALSGAPISASCVRALMREGRYEEAKALVPEPTRRAISAQEGQHGSR